MSKVTAPRLELQSSVCGTTFFAPIYDAVIVNVDPPSSTVEVNFDVVQSIVVPPAVNTWFR